MIRLTMIDPIRLLTQPGPRGQVVTQPHSDAFSSYGVKFLIESNSAKMLAEIREFLPDLLAGRVDITDASEAEHFYTYIREPDSLDTLLKNGSILSARRQRDELIQVLKTSIRLSVAEHAPDHVFVHAGVVSINGIGVLLPGKSFAGKSTLVKELVSLGAEYYSDEFAVLDHEGRVHPFAKPLSIRPSGSATQFDVRVKDLGGKPGRTPLAIGMILFTEYSPGSSWKPRSLSNAIGIQQLIRSTVGIRRDPRNCIATLVRLVDGATLFETKRNEAAEAAAKIYEITTRLND